MDTNEEKPAAQRPTLLTSRLRNEALTKTGTDCLMNLCPFVVECCDLNEN
jgi:hypothetical protein